MVPHHAGDEFEFSAPLIHGYFLCSHLEFTLSKTDGLYPMPSSVSIPACTGWEENAGHKKNTVAAVRTEKEQERTELGKVGPTHVGHTRGHRSG